MVMDTLIPNEVLSLLAAVALLASATACAGDFRPLETSADSDKPTNIGGKGDCPNCDPGLDELTDVEIVGVTYQTGSSLAVDVNWNDRDPSDQSKYTVELRAFRTIGEGRDLEFGTREFTIDAERTGGTSGLSLALDPFRALGKMDNDDRKLRSIAVTARVVQYCGIDACGSETTVHATSPRPIAFLFRGYPDATISLTNFELGEFNRPAYQRLTRQLEHSVCKNVLFSIGGTTKEGSANPNAVREFVAGQGYNCVVNLAYHDKDGSWGSVTSDDSAYFCDSTDTGEASVSSAQQNMMSWLEEEVQHWDVFGHSKGAAIAISMAKKGEEYLAKFPDTRVYAIGVPGRKGGELLDSFRPGWIERDDQIVSFTWSNDNVHNYGFCGDVFSAAYIGETHDYRRFFDLEFVAGNSQYEQNRQQFLAGKETYIGKQYRAAD